MLLYFDLHTDLTTKEFLVIDRTNTSRKHRYIECYCLQAKLHETLVYDFYYHILPGYIWKATIRCPACISHFKVWNTNNLWYFINFILVFNNIIWEHGINKIKMEHHNWRETNFLNIFFLPFIGLHQLILPFRWDWTCWYKYSVTWYETQM